MKRAARSGATPQPGVELQHLVAGINPLLAAAGVLLALLPQLRATTAARRPRRPARQLLGLIGEFEAAAARQRRAAAQGHRRALPAVQLSSTR